MGTGRKFRKKPMTRPIKSPAAKARRVKAQRARLVALGMDEAEVAKMDQKSMRQLAMRPCSIKSDK